MIATIKEDYNGWKSCIIIYTYLPSYPQNKSVKFVFDTIATLIASKEEIENIDPMLSIGFQVWDFD